MAALKGHSAYLTVIDEFNSTTPMQEWEKHSPSCKTRTIGPCPECMPKTYTVDQRKIEIIGPLNREQRRKEDREEKRARNVRVRTKR